MIMREISFGQDGSYSAEAIVTRANAELANSFGNLAQRVLSMISKNLDGVLRANTETTDADVALEETVRANIEMLKGRFEDLAFSDGLNTIMNAMVLRPPTIREPRGSG